MKEVKDLLKFKLVSWPTPQDYNEAIQNPASAFKDPELQQGEPELTALGLPRPRTGMFASVYRMHCPEHDWAVRCFLYDVADQHERYELIESRLRKLNLAYMVGFDHDESGLIVHGSSYPMMKMEWCEGQTLSSFIESHLDDRAALEQLAERFKEIVLDLRHHGLAHGDLQHGNILISGATIKLVDYDGMYVPELQGFQPKELGHRNYQHPGRDDRNFGPDLDNFSSWVIYLSLLCLSRDPSLWQHLHGGDECLILRQSDFIDPVRSFAFFELENHKDETIKRYSQMIRYLLMSPVTDVPPIGSELSPPADLPEVSPKSRLPDWMIADGHPDEPSGDSAMRAIAKHRNRWARERTAEERAEHAAAIAHISGRDRQNETASAISVDAPIAPRNGPPAPLIPYDTQYPWHLPAPFEKTIQVLLVLIVAASLILGARTFIDIQDPTFSSRYLGIPSSVEAFDANGRSNNLTAGDREFAKNNLDSARSYYLAVVDNLDRNTDPRSEKTLAIACTQLGNIRLIQKSFQKAANTFSHAMYHWRRLPKDQQIAERSQIGQTNANLALAYNQLGDLQRSVKCYEDAIRLLVDPGTRPDDAAQSVMVKYAMVLRKLGRDEDASRIENSLKSVQPSLPGSADRTGKAP